MKVVPETVLTTAAKLDADCPGWLHRINAATLNISSINTCVLMQVYGDWGRTRTRLMLNEDELEACADDRYLPLWLAEINRRLAE